MQWNAMKCNEMQWNAMKYNEMQWNAMKCNAMKCNEMQWNVMKSDDIQWNAMKINEDLLASLNIHEKSTKCKINKMKCVKVKESYEHQWKTLKFQKR